MGAVASRVLIDPALLEQIEETVIRPSVEGLVEDGLRFPRLPLCRLILTADGPKVLEYNCRFGDPRRRRCYR